MKRAMLIYNPSAGREEAKQFKDRAIEVLTNLGFDVTVKETQKQDDATHFAEMACTEKMDFLLAMGGDGTISEVVNGLAEREDRPLFSFVPLGTVNDFARALGIPLEPDIAIEALKMTNTEQVDVGRIGDKYFVNVVAIGDIASSVADTPVEQKTRYGSMAYLMAGAKAIISNEEVEMTITHDHGSWKGTSILVLVALTNSVGGFENLVKSAKIDDGKMHVFIIKQAGLAAIARMGTKVMLGTLGKDEGVETFTTEKLRIESNRPLFCNVDGDQGDCTPLDIHILPRHLEMLLPKKTESN
ncbi:MULTISPECIES: diacylglycerol kinase family protein [unclassified Psychrobacillus]|uniref:diacylglycerol/lipid kinase family protein n=1 Tax=unclassified Psychrobacillus TaxID=2636677 RepID=UPI00146AC2DD|nr:MULTISPECIES: diacylglycerol kinase family protein [unclassified Psychrobacillus]MCM3357606.1 diacylglycerol kinase family lipid kinase [Psychrobacillus sp. MER TA 171]NME07671.1 diacylglycerol kinase family lipid kinase [Psychrobacillus sp. BL-248-WT-3]